MSLELLNAKRVAELLECDEVTVGQRALSGELPGLKIGRGWVFPAEALAARLNELALEQSALRRKPRNQPTATVVPVPARAGRRKAPVPLPSA